MTLSFFRRHRTMFMVLMAMSLFGILVVGWWNNVEQKFSAWFGPQGTRRVVGSIGGEPVRLSQLMEFHSDLRRAVLADVTWRVGLNPQAKDPRIRQGLFGLYLQVMAFRYPWFTVAMEERPNLTRAMAWLALYREARRYGFEATDAEVNTYLEDLQGAGLRAEDLGAAIEQVAGGRQQVLYAAMRKELTLRLYVQWLAETLSGPVDSELRRAFTEKDERIKVRLAVLRASDFLKKVGEIPEATLQQQFAKYKDFLPGGSPEGFGYRIPDRVAVEYLVADPEAFKEQAAAKVTDESLRPYYESAKDPEYLVKNGKAEPPAGAEKGEPQTQEKVFRPFEEVRDSIRALLVRREAEALAREYLQTNAAEIRAAGKGVDLGIWADGRQVRHEVVPGLHAQEQLAALEGIGKAKRGEETFAAHAMALTEFVGPAKAKLAVMEMSEPFQGPAGEGYAFRVTEASPSRQPASLEEVRDAVLADERRMEAFEIARREGKALFEAAAKGLQPAARAAGVAVISTGEFSRQGPIPEAPPDLRENPLVLNECFRMVRDLQPQTIVVLGRDQAVVVAELTDRRLPREAAFKADRSELAVRVGQQLAQAALQQVLDIGSIQRRMTVVVELPESEKKAEQEDDLGGE